MSSTIVLDSPEKIFHYRLASLRGALKLEMLGMKRKGQSAFAELRKLGYKGTKAAILVSVEQSLKKLRDA